ncbi:hypothetical protein QBC34DRAFT_412363, partial [Podospora aff. communis PSN243]
MICQAYILPGLHLLIIMLLIKYLAMLAHIPRLAGSRRRLSCRFFVGVLLPFHVFFARGIKKSTIPVPVLCPAQNPKPLYETPFANEHMYICNGRKRQKPQNRKCNKTNDQTPRQGLAVYPVPQIPPYPARSARV